MIGEYRKDRSLPFTAASAIPPYCPVILDATATSVNRRQVVPIATNGVEPIGITGPATALAGESVTVYDDGAVVEAVSVASIGPNQDVAIASTNGALGLVAGASGVTRYRVGKNLESAAAGERFSILVKPKQLSNLI